MKKISKIALLFSSITLSSIAGATEEKYSLLFYVLNYHHMFNADNKELKDRKIGNHDLIGYYRMSATSSIIFDNGFALMSQLNIGFLRLNQKLIEIDNNKLKKEISNFDLELFPLGYAITNGDFNFGIFGGIGTSFEAHIIRAKINNLTSFYIPTVIWSDYKINENYTIYNVVQYNPKFMYNTKHEIKFDLGLRYKSSAVGLFINYYSMPYKNESRVNTLTYGLSAGFLFRT